MINLPGFKRCKQCSTRNLSTANFCTYCGKLIPAKILSVEVRTNEGLIIVQFEGGYTPMAFQTTGSSDKEHYDNLCLGFWDPKEEKIYY